jgi:hypothetical protein
VAGDISHFMVKTATNIVDREAGMQVFLEDLKLKETHY